MKLVRCLFALSILFIMSTVNADTVRLTSLDWPPYTSPSMDQQGASVVVARAAFEAMGHKLEVDFYPWKRAVYLAKNGEYDGYFPEYYAEELKESFILSEPMGSGPLGLAELKKKPIQWNSLEDLKRFTIGTVSGYVNTAEFDDMVSRKELKVSEASDDIKNLLKLSSGRMDAAVVDKNVLSYLLASDPKLKSKAASLQFNSNLLEDKKLYICFTKGPKGEKWAEILKEGLTKINVEEIMKNYLDNL